MMKFPSKWFSLFLCAVVCLLNSSTLDAQRKRRNQTNATQNAASAAPTQAVPASENEPLDEGVQEPEQGAAEETDFSEEITEDTDASDEAAEATPEQVDEPEEAEPAFGASKDQAEDTPAQEGVKGASVIGTDYQKEESEAATASEPADAQEDQIAEKGQEAAVEEPSAKEPEQKELGPDEIVGIDTIDLEDPQGNWLYKRVWWERAEAKYEKIRTAVTSVLEVRTKFFAQRAELDKNVLDPFYVKTGFSQGELKEKLSERIAQLEKDIANKGDTELLERLEANKQILEDLQKEVAAVVKQDEEVENAILMLVEQAQKMRQYEQQAWQDFKNIARVLDDKKARELFYKVDGAWRNIQELQKYLESNFSQGFEQLIERVKQQVQKVDAAMEALKEKGVSLLTEETDEQEEEEEPAPQGFFSRFIITPIKTVFSTIWDIIMWPIRKLMGTQEVTEPEEQEDVGEPEQEEQVDDRTAEDVQAPDEKTEAQPKEVSVAPEKAIAAPPAISQPQPEGTIPLSGDEKPFPQVEVTTREEGAELEEEGAGPEEETEVAQETTEFSAEG